MPELDPDYIANLRKHSIASWKRVYLACGFAFLVTFVGTLFASSVPAFNAVVAFGILFSVMAIFYAAAAVGLTTYFETSARNDYANSLFSTSTLPLEMFIMKDALKRGSK